MLKYYDTRKIDSNCNLSQINDRVFIPTSYYDNPLSYLKKNMPVWIKSEDDTYFIVYILDQDLSLEQFNVAVNSLLTLQNKL